MRSSVPADYFAVPSEGADSDASIRRRRLWSAIAVVIFFLLAYLASLGPRPLVRPDEFRYGEIPREMLEDGDWITPRLLGMRYFEKPSLGYQLIALSFALFGENRFALRLPSALGAGVTAAGIFMLLALRTRRAWLPALGAILFLSFALVLGTGVFAVLDAPFSMGVFLSLLAAYLAVNTISPRARVAWWIVAGLGAGIAFLIKGFLGFLLPALVLGPFLLFRRDGRAQVRFLWIPLLTALVTVFPWSLCIHLREPDFWNYFVVVEHWKRFFSATHDSLPDPFWALLPVLFGGILPPGFLFLLTRGAWSREFLRHPLCVFSLLGIVLPLLLFSLSSCKLGTYILPCFPFIAILLALSLDRARQVRPFAFERALRWTIRGWSVLLLLTAAVGSVLWQLHSSLWESPIPPTLVLAALTLWGVLLWRFARAAPLIRAAVLAFGFALTAPAIFSALPTESMVKKMPEEDLTRCLTELRITPSDAVFVDRQAMQAVAWILDNDHLYLIGDTGELTYPLTRYPEYAHRHFASLDDIPADLFPPGSRIYVSLSRAKNFRRPTRSPVLATAVSSGIMAIRF